MAQFEIDLCIQAGNLFIVKSTAELTELRYETFLAAFTGTA